MWKVTFKALAAKKWRVLLTSVAIVLGVAFMAGTLVLSDTITRTFNNLVVNVNAGLAAQVRGVSQFKDTQGNQQRNRIDASLVDTVQQVPGVKDAVASVSGFAIIVDKQGKGLNTNGQAPPLAFAWNSSPQLNPMRIVAGHPPSAPDQIVIDKHSADVTGYTIGDQVRVIAVSGSGTERALHPGGHRHVRLGRQPGRRVAGLLHRARGREAAGPARQDRRHPGLG